MFTHCSGVFRFEKETPMNWINLFALAPLQGYVYFEALVDETTNHAIGWSARTQSAAPYGYDIVYSDGVNEVRSTRGTFEHARYAVEGLAAHFSGRAAALPVPILVRYASEGWIVSEVFTYGSRQFLVTRPPRKTNPQAETTEQVLGSGPTLLTALLDAASKE